jgi:hypothetical protein
MNTSASPCGQVNFRAPWNAENRWLRQAFHNRKHWMHLGSKEGGPQASAFERPVRMKRWYLLLSTRKLRRLRIPQPVAKVIFHTLTPVSS